MEVNLLVRPGEVVQRGGTVIMAFESTQPPRLAEFPPLPERSVHYVVYMAVKHWRRVAPELETPNMLLNVTGHCFYDAETKSIAVLARKVDVRSAQSRRPGGPA